MKLAEKQWLHCFGSIGPHIFEVNESLWLKMLKTPGNQWLPLSTYMTVLALISLRLEKGCK